MRSARLALLDYSDGEKRYIIAPVGVVGEKISSGPTAPPEIGNALPLKAIPVSTAIHNLEITPGRGGQMVRSAGGSATLMSRDEGYAQIRLPSGEIRRISEECYATIGQVGNTEHENIILGKAGRTRHRGHRGITRGGHATRFAAIRGWPAQSQCRNQVSRIPAICICRISSSSFRKHAHRTLAASFSGGFGMAASSPRRSYSMSAGMANFRNSMASSVRLTRLRALAVGNDEDAQHDVFAGYY